MEVQIITIITAIASLAAFIVVVFVIPIILYHILVQAKQVAKNTSIMIELQSFQIGEQTKAVPAKPKRPEDLSDLESIL